VSSAVRYTTRHIAAALALYETGLSSRGVARELAKQFDPAPSNVWVDDLVRREGIARSRSRAMELREQTRRGRNYDAIRPLAFALARERQLSPRQIADELGVSRTFARRVCLSVARERDRVVEVCQVAPVPGRGVRGVLGMLRRSGFAETEETRRRRARLAEVADLYLNGATYREIQERTGVPMGTITFYVRTAGINPNRSPRWKGALA